MTTTAVCPICDAPQGEGIASNGHVTSGNCAIMERPRGAGNTDRGLTHTSRATDQEGSVKATRICTIEGCDKPFRARGWCVTHYWRWSQHGDPMRLVKAVMPDTCEAEGCDKQPDAGRWCGKHRARLTRLGTVDLAARDRYQQPSGYWNVKRVGHPLADPRGWVREHRVVLYDSIGPGDHPCNWCGNTVSWDRTYPKHSDGLVVDHVDENMSNNDPGNLVPSCSPCNLARSSRWKKRRQESA